MRNCRKVLRSKMWRISAKAELCQRTNNRFDGDLNQAIDAAGAGAEASVEPARLAPQTASDDAHVRRKRSQHPFRGWAEDHYGRCTDCSSDVRKTAVVTDERASSSD